MISPNISSFQYKIWKSTWHMKTLSLKNKFSKYSIRQIILFFYFIKNTVSTHVFVDWSFINNTCKFSLSYDPTKTKKFFAGEKVKWFFVWHFDLNDEYFPFLKPSYISFASTLPSYLSTYKLAPLRPAALPQSLTLLTIAYL